MMIGARSNICSILIRNVVAPKRTFATSATYNLLTNHHNQIDTVNIRRSSTTAEIETSNGKGILSRVFGRFKNSQTILRVTSALLYESVANKVNYYDFFEEFDMPDTFNSWFLVTELHCHLLLVRVMNEGSEANEDGRFMRNTIVETMWNDVQNKAKKICSDNPSIARRQVQAMSEQFQAALIAYDEGIMSDDKVLASVLWRRFFEMNCDDYTKLEKLVLYVRKTMNLLDSMSREEIMNNRRVNWFNIKDIAKD